MSITYNPQGTINWPKLDGKLIDAWHDIWLKEREPAKRFVFGFVLVNHYYSAWSEVSPPANHRDRTEMKHLSTFPPLAAHWSKLRELTDIKDRKISLPLKDRGGSDVPAGLAARAYKVSELSCIQWLDVIYQIRCDLVHAVRRPDEATLHFAGSIHELVTYLLKETAKPG